jgi:dTDP-4-amino-4,6-dideoxygalactose transaminase
MKVDDLVPRGGTSLVTSSRREVPFVDLRAIHRELATEIDAAMRAVVDAADFILGGAVEAFEAAFATYCGVRAAVGVDSGFSALELALRACGVGAGDEVVTAANTFIATVAAIESTGARPVLIDVDPVTRNLDPVQLADVIGPSTRAVIPVHLYGRPAEMDDLATIARAHGLAIVEDACQAHGARYRGRRAGSLGDAAAFSFYPSKNLGAYGDGGMVVTDDPEIAERVRLLRNLGSRVRYVHEEKGFNRRLDTLQAAILACKLPHLDRHNESRRAIAQAYRDHLPYAEITTPAECEHSESVHHLFVIEADRRDDLQQHLLREGIATGIHYPVPVHLQPAYASLGYGKGRFPVSERLAERVLSLPMYPHMPPESVAFVASAIAAFVRDR